MDKFSSDSHGSILEADQVSSDVAASISVRADVDQKQSPVPPVENSTVRSQCKFAKFIELGKSEDRACTRCGVIGHTSDEHHINCSSCEGNHPLGECPNNKISCFLCEGQDHCPSQCAMYSLLTSAMQRQRDNFRATVVQELAKKGMLSSTQALSQEQLKEKYQESSSPPQKRSKSMTLGSCSLCGKQGHCVRRCSQKNQAQTLPLVIPKVSSVQSITPRSRGAASKNQICYACRKRGHFAKQCPFKYEVPCGIEIVPEATSDEPILPSMPEATTEADCSKKQLKKRWMTDEATNKFQKP